jgi:hypothetical protein
MADTMAIRPTVSELGKTMEIREFDSCEAKANVIRNWSTALAAAFLLLAAWQVSGAQSSAPIITTVAGGGNPTGNGDWGPATAARLNNVQQVAVDTAGNLYLAESYAFRVRKVSTTGIISTLAGNGDQLYNGDNIPAISAAIDVRGIAVDASGNVYIADGANRRIRRVGVNGIITSVASGLDFPTGIAVSPSGAVYFIDGSRISRIGAGGVIQAVAGTAEYGFAGDNGPAISALLASPSGIAFDSIGNLYIADYGNDRVRRVSTDGVITTVAGGGPFRSDPVVINTKIRPRSVAADGRGNIYIAEVGNMVRIVNAQGITRVSVGEFNDTTFGNVGAPHGFSGDGGPALEARLHEPVSLALDAQDNLYIADNRNERIRKVTPIPTPVTPPGVNAFSPYTSTPVGSFTQHVAVADITGDGRDDALLTTTTWSGPYAEPENDFRLLLFVQKSDGTLAPPVKYPYSGDSFGRSGRGLATADLNSDGFADVIVGTLRGITIYLGSTSGLSAGIEHSAVPNAEVTTQLTTMDVDRDGKLDVLTFSSGRQAGGTSPYDQAGILIYYGNGAGGITSKRFQPRADELGWKYLRATDVNMDGFLDLTSTWTGFVGGYPSGGVEVTPHDGASGFMATNRMRVSTPAWWGQAYAMGDFNSDGLPDAVVSVGGNAPQAEYALFNQQKGGRFLQARLWKSYDSPEDMISADMNGDGRDDLLVVHGGWSSIGYHPQTDEGLGEEIKYYVRQSGNPRFPSIAVGDLNGDGCKDVAMADYNYGLIILRGRHCMIRVMGSPPLLPPHHNPAPALVSQSTTQGTEAVQPLLAVGNTGAGKDRSATHESQASRMVRGLVAWLWRPFPLFLTLGALFWLGWIIRPRVR